MTAVLRQSISSLLAVFEDATDADRLSGEPVTCQVVGSRAVSHCGAILARVQWLAMALPRAGPLCRLGLFARGLGRGKGPGMSLGREAAIGSC